MSTVIEDRYFIFVDGNNNNNKFYRYQLQDDGSIITTWGRVGQKASSGMKSGGKPALERLIRERTSPKKGYVETEIAESSATATAGASIEKSRLASIAATALTADGTAATGPVASLIQRLVTLNKHEIVAASGGKIEVATDGVVRSALGIVTQNNIVRARTILHELVSDQTNVSLVNQYLSLIPQKTPMRKGWGTEFLTQITTPEKQADLLDQLEQSVQWYEANRDAAEKKARVEAGKPETEDYSDLFRYRVREISDGSPEFSRIATKYRSEKNPNHQWSSLRPIRAFELVAPDTDEKEFQELATKLGNVKHYWHGSRAFNILSILRRGLFTPPRSGSAIPIAGRMFGDGVYTSADASKSLGYSHGYWSAGGRDDNCFMFLADVVAGREYTPTTRYHDPSIPRTARSGGYDSINVRAGFGGVRNHEAIVWNDRQVQLRYLVEFNK